MLDNLLRGHALGFRAVIDQYAMAQYRGGYGLNVLSGYVAAALQERARFGSEHEELGGTQTGS